MFDLERAITEWRRQMTAGGLDAPGVLDELELHLREEAEKLGSGSQEGFEQAVKQMGEVGALKSEFGKIGVCSWSKRLAYAAWVVFAVSFALPSYAELWGFQCALLQNFFWEGVMKGDWGCVHYELLTLANLLMVASPVLLFRLGNRAAFLRCFRWATLAAALLVCSFIAWLDLTEVKIGCYAWAASYLLLCLSTFQMGRQEESSSGVGTRRDRRAA